LKAYNKAYEKDSNQLGEPERFSERTGLEGIDRGGTTGNRRGNPETDFGRIVSTIVAECPAGRRYGGMSALADKESDYFLSLKRRNFALQRGGMVGEWGKGDSSLLAYLGYGKGFLVFVTSIFADV